MQLLQDDNIPNFDDVVDSYTNSLPEINSQINNEWTQEPLDPEMISLPENIHTDNIDTKQLNGSDWSLLPQESNYLIKKKPDQMEIAILRQRLAIIKQMNNNGIASDLVEQMMIQAQSEIQNQDQQLKTS
jgi:hypothetical protein